MKNEFLSCRVNPDLKKKLELLAQKNNQSLSALMVNTLRDRAENEDLNDSQKQLMKIIDLAFKNSYEQYHKQEMLVLNKNNFNSEMLIEILDLFMKHLKIPQTKADVKTSFVNHPITEIAREKIIKNIRSQSAKKNEKGINEYE